MLVGLFGLYALWAYIYRSNTNTTPQSNKVYMMALVTVKGILEWLRVSYLFSGQNLQWMVILKDR